MLISGDKGGFVKFPKKKKEVAKKMKKSTNHLFDTDSILAHDRNYRKTHPDYKSKTQ